MSIDVRKFTALAAALLLPLSATACGLSMQSLSPTAGVNAETYSVTMKFTDASLLPVGGQVRIGQAVIGQVHSVDVEDAIALARTDLQSDIVLKRGSTARIQLSTPLSDAFIEVTPGHGDETLSAGDTIDTDHTGRGPDVEKVLLSVGSLVGGAGLGQLGIILDETDAALNGRGEFTRGLLDRLNSALSVIAAHHDSIGRTIDALGRFAATMAEDNTDLRRSLTAIDGGLSLLSDQRGSFSELVPKIEHLSAATQAVIDTSAPDLVDIATHIGPVADQLTAFRDDVTELDHRLGRTAELLSNASPGDYLNADLDIDLEEVVEGQIRDLLPDTAPEQTQETPR